MSQSSHVENDKVSNYPLMSECWIQHQPNYVFTWLASLLYQSGNSNNQITVVCKVYCPAHKRYIEYINDAS